MTYEKKLCTFLTTIVASAPFFFNPLLALSKMTYEAFDLPEEDPLITRMKELKKRVEARFNKKIFLGLCIFVSLNQAKSFSWMLERNAIKNLNTGQGFHGHFNETTQKHEQSVDEKECLNLFIDSLYARIDNGEYPLSRFNLATLEGITDGKFVHDMKHCYVRFHIADGTLDDTLLSDRCFQYISGLCLDYKVHIHDLPDEETSTTIFCLLDPIVEKKVEYNRTKSKYSSSHASDSDIPVYGCVLKPSFANSHPESDLLYDRLSCAHSVGAGIDMSWGGNEPTSYNVQAHGSASDKHGNSVHGGYNCDSNGRSTVSLD